MRKISCWHSTVITLLLLSCLCSQTFGQEYKEYRQSSSRELYFKLMYNQDRFGYSVEENGTSDRFTCNRSDMVVRGDKLLIDNLLLVDSKGLHVGTTVYFFEKVSDIRVSEDHLGTVISFYTRPESEQRVSRIRRGNIIKPTGTVVVQEDDFIRGAVLTFTGNIEIYGEVSKDVVSLFGDVFVASDAVVRGDVASVTGQIDLAQNASVYGEVRSGTDSRLGRKHRFSRFRSTYQNMFEIKLDGTSSWYNRVDGLSLGMTLRFADPDSLLPTAWAGGNYALESARWRYNLGLEQTIMRNPALVLGGSAYRRLASEDDWILSSSENSAFCLLAGQDYKDYYEAEGANAYLKLRPIRNLLFQTGFNYEETKWLDAQSNLWSLFSDDNGFRANFSSVDSATHAVGIEVIDTSTNYTWYASLDYDTQDEDDPYYHSSWTAQGSIEWSNPDLDSDFDYTRYRISVVRHQRLNRHLMAIIRGLYGGSDGILPMHKQFYLGGLGTLHGYEHKEYSGQFFWLAGIEYRFVFPHSDYAASLIWDLGQVSQVRSFEGAEVKHSLGVAIYFGSDFRIGLAKRLDRSDNDKPEFFARFTHSLP
ncbi:MAG: BamA/TamA family outer membrane protein [candidate division Zixibacteria bacterium]|nr:BamA/TamA family outer membrane protein [candidate division Zixibacteria bacterium]